MFTFFHRRKKIVVDCFTADSFAYEYAPIIRGSKAFPSWWTKLPITDINNINFSLEQKNMRKCYGFLEFYKRSLVVPCWTDIRFKVTPNNGYSWFMNFKSPGSDPIEHAKSQYEGGFTDYYHTKLQSPWYISEKSGVHFLFTAAIWNLENYDFVIPPGILEYGVNHATNVNILMPKRKSDYSFFLPVGKPLVHIIPISDFKIEIRNHLITSQEIAQKFPPPTTLRGIFPLLDMKRKEKKCPFGFS